MTVARPAARRPAARRPGEGTAWLRCFEPRPSAALRLVCFPHAGGSAAVFRFWHRHLPPATEVLAVQYPGRADRIREPTVSDARAMARAVVAELPAGPVALFGHSMGATVAYEVARLAPPVHLLAASARAPHDAHDEEPLADADDARLLKYLRRLGGAGIEVLEHAELRALVLPYIRADLRLVETYAHAPGPPLACPVTALVGDADPLVRPDQAGRWGGTTNGTFTPRVLRGGHFLPEEDLLSEVAAALGRCPTA